MTSERKIDANRNNAKESTRPRSEGGRSVSRHNALRHGLAVSIGNELAFGGDVEDFCGRRRLRSPGRTKRQARQIGEVRASRIFQAQARPARHVKKRLRSKCRIS